MSDAPLMLSVSGLRGLVGQSLTPPVAARYGAAFGSWLKGQPRADGSKDRPPHVVLGRDSRPSGPWVEQAVTAGLLAVGCRVTSLGIVTTPSVAIMAEHLGADGGMVITASHNPIIWNGIKALRHDGVAPPPEQAKEIIERFKADRLDYVGVEALQSMARDDSTHAVHAKLVMARVDAGLVRKRRPRVVLDSVHGAGGAAAAIVLKELGVDLVHLYAEPTGQFPHPPEPTRENLVSLGKAVRDAKADIGFAQDPDADRLAVVDERGEYIGEEYTLALAALHVLAREGKKGASVAANLSTSRMLDDIAAAAGATVVRTPVGEANVAAAMRKNGCVIGGEGNGGVIFPPICFVRDSIAGIALILELLSARNEPLSRIVGRIPSYAILKDKVDLKPGMGERIAPTLRAHFAGQKIDEQDGVRIDWPDRWVHVRTSNTEPIMRLIAEARDAGTAKKLIAEVRGALGLK
ncbi:MAG: phosphoglucosamine mutase [Planctomycetota bacterium]|nr:phosphoglucosamine mutase [Planctomycetota bacterium]